MAKKIQKTEYSYGQLIQSKRYRGQRDILAALLDPARKYTVSEVDALIDGFMKGTVK